MATSDFDISGYQTKQVECRIFQSDEPWRIGDCMAIGDDNPASGNWKGPRVAIYSDGNAFFRSYVQSTDDDDEFKVSIIFIGADGKEFHRTQVYTVEISHDNRWYECFLTFAFPPHFYGLLSTLRYTCDC